MPDFVTHLLGLDDVGYPASFIHVWWPWRRPCGVSPGSTGSHEASAVSSAGICPDPPHRLTPGALWVTRRPSRRRFCARLLRRASDEDLQATSGT